MLINEIFYSLQGEGYFTGTPSIFIRFSGCNLKCPFCDTRHQSGQIFTEHEIVEMAKSYPATHVVITGGEPALQLTANLVYLLHEAGKFVAIETNGTYPLPSNVDWITCSPKSGIAPSVPSLAIERCDELKVLYTGQVPQQFPTLQATYRFIQPCDTGDEKQNRLLLEGAVNYCLQHPEWRLSLQTHKLIGVR